MDNNEAPAPAKSRRTHDEVVATKLAQRAATYAKEDRAYRDWLVSLTPEQRRMLERKGARKAFARLCARTHLAMVGGL